MIIGFIVGVVLASGVAVYANYSYFANNVKYTDSMTVDKASDDLFANTKDTTEAYNNGYSAGYNKCKNKTTIFWWFLFLHWSGMRESNSRDKVGSIAFYH